MLIASISGITSVCKVTDKLIYFSLNFTARYVCSIQQKYGAYPGGENPDIPDEADEVDAGDGVEEVGGLRRLWLFERPWLFGLLTEHRNQD